jgi:hypothetical protein
MAGGINFGLAFGSALSSGIRTYADLQALQMKQAEFKQQQDQWGREDQERQAAAQGANGTTTAVTPGTIADQMKGADGKADGDAVMSTYGAMQDPTQAPSVTKNIMAGGVQQGQMANDTAGQGDQSVKYAQRVDTPGIPGAPVQAAAAPGAPSGFNAPTGNPVDTATQYVRAQEGGYVANDNGHGPTNYGINGLANGLPADQVKNLTPQQADQIYKTKYFSGANGGVDISKLPTSAAVAVGDTAANMGQAKAKALWEQSGGDLSKFLDLRQKAYDSIPGDQATHAVWNKRMDSIREFVNQHGTSETVPGDSSGMPVAPQTKVVELDAKPISKGATGIGDTVTFTHDENGNVQMTKADTGADSLMRMATKAFQVGDLKNGPTLMNAAIQARAAQAQQQVSSILTNDKLDQDSKVAQLAGIAGAKAYKTEQGNYIIPGLGPVDARGNPMPMTMTQVGALSSQMATPDGLHHVVETQIALQKAATESRTADQKDTELSIEQQKANASTGLTTAETKLKAKQGDYYEANAAATNDSKNAQAADRSEAANIKAKLQDLEQQASQLDPKDPDYVQKIGQIRLQHDMLLSRASGKPGSSADAKPEKLQDGETRAYKRPDGTTEIRTFNAAAGAEIPAQQEPLIRQGIADMKSDPDTFKGVIAGQNGGKWGFGLDPKIAKNYGLNPDEIYRSPQEAVAALRASKVTRNPSALPFGGVGIPQAQPSVSDYTPGG